MPKQMPIPANMQTAISMYSSGASVVQVAAYLDVSLGTATRLLRRCDIKIRSRGSAAGSLVPQVSQDDTDDAPLSRPPVTPEYLSILRRRWAEKIPLIVSIALQESLPPKRPGERPSHVR